MGCGVRPPQGLAIKAVVYECLVLKISDPLFLQGDDDTYSTILPKKPLDIYAMSIYDIHRLEELESGGS